MKQRWRERWRILLAHSRLEAVDDFSYPVSVAMDQLGKISPVLLYFFVARLVGPEGPQNARVGGDYYTFAVIGLSVAVVLQVALSGFGGRLERVQSHGTFETLLVEPVPWTFIPIALNVWRMTLGVIDCGVMLALGLLLDADYRLAGLPTFIGIMFLGILAATSIGILAASLIVLAKRAQPVLAFYGFVAGILGGALFPVELLPGWLRPVSYLIPHTYVISTARKVFMNSPPAGGIDVGTAVIVLAVFNVVMFTVGMRLFSRSLEYARKVGTLSGY